MDKLGGSLRESSSKRRKSKKPCLSENDKENAAASLQEEVNKPQVPESKQKKRKSSKSKEDDDDYKKKKKVEELRTLKKKKSKRHTLTGNAIEGLVKFAQFIVGKDQQPRLPETLIVRMRVDDDQSLVKNDPTRLVTLDDGTHTLPVLLLDDPRNEALQACFLQQHATPIWTVIAIRAFMATDGYNPKYDLAPVLCLTRIDILSSEGVVSVKPSTTGTPYRWSAASTATTRNHFSASSPSKQQQQQQQEIAPSTVSVRAGRVGTFLDQTLPFLTTEEFVRCHDTATQRLLRSEPALAAEPAVSTTQEPHEETITTLAVLLNQHADQVQTFATRHAAMMTLQRADSQQPTAEQAVRNNYFSALREFASSQLDRQKASLASNAGREAADRATLITSQYNAALEQAMAIGTSSTKDEENVLTPERLMQWHKTLLQDLHPEAGQIRSKTVRAGHTVFCRPKDIVSELDKFCLALERLQERLQLKKREQQTPLNAWHAILFAAVAMYGIVDIHPFADGNGRMSRIVANWALGSFPFTINVFATPAQRAEYILALETTRHLLSMSNRKKVYGTVSSDEHLQVIKSIGCFAPMVQLLMDCTGRAVVEFHRVWEEKSGLVAEALESKAARQARERAKEGTCIICLDENPNIATLCCGKAVHLNCIAEWLSGKNSCPCCRSGMPSISGRVVRAARGEAMDHHNAASPSMRRAQRRYVSNAQDVLVSLFNNYQGDTTTSEDHDYSDDAHDTTTGDAYEEDEDEARGSRYGIHSDDDNDDDDSDDESEESYRSDLGAADANYTAMLRRLGYTSQDPASGNDDEESSRSDGDPDDADYAYRAALRRLYGNVRNTAEGPSRDSDDEDGGEIFEGAANAEEEEEGRDSLETTTSAPRPHEYCDALYCRNRPATDCTNNLCGRCCVLGGEFHCPRHNS